MLLFADTTGTPEQIAQLASTPSLVANLVNQLEKGDWNVQKEAVWALSNMVTTGGDDVLHYAVACKALGPLVRMLRVDDPKIITVALEAVSAVLEAERRPNDPLGRAYADLIEEVGGVDALEALQQHASQDIYEKAVAVMEAYYGGDDEDAAVEDENSAPVVAPGAKTFAFGGSAPPAAFGGFSSAALTAAPGPVGGAFNFGFLSNTQFK